MNAEQIRKCLRVPNFLGVFAADELPSHFPWSCGLVVNTDPRSEPGTHWLAIYIDGNGHGEYFDSYGLKPFVPQHLKFLNRLKQWRYNKTKLQSLTSTLCGQYCVLYLDSKFRGYSLNRFLRNMVKHPYKDGYVMQRFFQKFGTVKSRKVACQSCRCYKELRRALELICR